MSYVPPRRRSDRNKAVVAGSLGAVLAAVLIIWLVVRYASENPDDVNLARRTFPVGRATRLAEEIEENGPFLFKDPLTSRAGRELYLQHVGDDVKKGWVAIEAYAPGAPREVRCVLRWMGDAFDDPCGDTSFDAAGSGLTTYPAKVNTAGVVEVDLRSS